MIFQFGQTAVLPMSLYRGWDSSRCVVSLDHFTLWGQAVWKMSGSHWHARRVSTESNCFAGWFVWKGNKHFNSLCWHDYCFEFQKQQQHVLWHGQNVYYMTFFAATTRAVSLALFEYHMNMLGMWELLFQHVRPILFILVFNGILQAKHPH